jgi:hypothetical protein
MRCRCHKYYFKYHTFISRGQQVDGFVDFVLVLLGGLRLEKEGLTLDRKMTNRIKYQGRAIAPHVVKKTWRVVLKNEEELPQGWEKGEKTGVLVSIELPG